MGQTDHIGQIILGPYGPCICRAYRVSLWVSERNGRTAGKEPMQGSMNLDRTVRKMERAADRADRAITAAERLTRKLERRTARRIAAAERATALEIQRAESAE